MFKLSRCGEVWYRAWFGSKRPRVRIPTLRPVIPWFLPKPRYFPILFYGVFLQYIPFFSVARLQNNKKYRNINALRVLPRVQPKRYRSTFLPLRLHFSVVFGGSEPLFLFFRIFFSATTVAGIGRILGRWVEAKTLDEGVFFVVSGTCGGYPAPKLLSVYPRGGVLPQN